MNKPNLANVFKSVKTSVSKHSPEILTAFGIGGMVTTTILAVKATPKALRLLEEKRKEEWRDKLTPKEVVGTTWKCYIPAAITGAASIACLIGANQVHARRGAALATAYKLSETALAEYKDKVIETLGEKKEKAIRDKVAEERVKENPVSRNEVIITSKGNTLCYDVISGRYFKSDIDHIKKTVNEINRRMLNEMYISLNEFYDELDVDLRHIKIGDDLGWCVDKGLLEIDFSSQIADDGTPCLVMDYRIEPQYGYSKLF